MVEGTNRRLAAIVSADVVGYSRLMGADEVGTHTRLQRRFINLIEPKIAAFSGRLVKLMGDGLLAEFHSVVDAVSWAVETQEKCAELDTDQPDDHRITFRVGINIGDIIADGDDIFGDGVNVAARLQELAEPGGICISDKVHAEILGKLGVSFIDGGDQVAKNIALPIQIWHWMPDGSAGLETQAKAIDAAIPGSNRPSIAVLSFSNLSNDPEQAFFADGIVEDLITALSRFPWLFVVSRNSSFSYKGKNVSASHVASDLNVRYVVEGSVRSSDNRLRVSVQLIEAAIDQHVWAESYDRPVGDLFDLQDEITQSITGVLVPALSDAERDRSLRDNRPDLDAWRTYQKGLAHFYRPYSHADNSEARRLFDHAVKLDGSFADAHAMIAMMGVYALDSGQTSYNTNAAEILDEAERSAKLAVQYGDNNALSHLVLGRVYGRKGEFESGIAECEYAVRLNPNLATAYHELGFTIVLADRYEEAISHFDQAIKLSPNDPSRWNFYLLKGIALFGMERFEDAIACFKEATRLRPTAFWPYIHLTASLSAANRPEEARAALAEALKRNRDLSRGFFIDYFDNLSKVPSYAQRWLGELRKAGLPE